MSARGRTGLAPAVLLSAAAHAAGAVGVAGAIAFAGGGRGAAVVVDFTAGGPGGTGRGRAVAVGLAGAGGARTGGEGPQMNRASAPSGGAERSSGASGPAGWGEGLRAGTPEFAGGILPEIRDRGVLRSRLERYYPARARAEGIEGQVVLELVVSATGRVADARVVRSDPPLFGEAALAALREIEFVPARLGGRPVAARIRLPIRFVLDR